MKRPDKILSLVILGLMPPVVCMLSLWWGSIPFLRDSKVISYLALGGLFIGILLDVTVLKKFLFRLFELPLPALAAIEVFYSIMVYGFFMGFPFFNAGVGIAWGYIVAKRGILQNKTKERIRIEVNRFHWVSFVILFLLCVCSAILAVSEKTICSQIQGMFRLPFTVTMDMIWAAILVGGALLLFVQYIFSSFVMKKALRLYICKSDMIRW